MFYTVPSAVWPGSSACCVSFFTPVSLLWLHLKHFFLCYTGLSALTFMSQCSWEDILCDGGKQEKIYGSPCVNHHKSSSCITIASRKYSSLTLIDHSEGKGHLALIWGWWMKVLLPRVSLFCRTQGLCMSVSAVRDESNFKQPDVIENRK